MAPLGLKCPGALLALQLSVFGGTRPDQGRRLGLHLILNELAQDTCVDKEDAK